METALKTTWPCKEEDDNDDALLQLHNYTLAQISDPVTSNSQVCWIMRMILFQVELPH